MILARRFVVIFALMFWQGGFMFYGAVTVPVMLERLGHRPERSQITQKVTQWMNLAGTAAIVAMFADAWTSALKVKRGRWLAWLAMALPQPALVLLHRELTRQMGSSEFSLNLHWIYLALNIVQWVGGMVYAVLSLNAWRAEDRAPRSRGESGHS